VFERLPAGGYLIAAAKDGYVTMNAGARKPGRPGVRIALADGERRAVSVRLPRGAVITGTISGQDGQPMAGLAVYAAASRFSMAAGARQLTPVTNPFTAASSDDRGVFRIYGLAAGEYAVATFLRPGPDMSRFALDSGVVVNSPAEVRAALAAVRGASSNPAAGPAPVAAPPVEPRRAVSLSPVYYPGTTTLDQAALITVAEGEERTGVDFTVEYVPLAAVEGFVSPADQAGSAFVTLTSDSQTMGLQGPRTARTTPEGRFTVNGIAPGTYTLAGRVSRRAPDGQPQILFGVTEIVVAGDDIGGVQLSLQPGLTLSGRLAFEGAAAPDVDFSKVRAFLPAGVIRGSIVAGALPELKLEADGRFSIHGVAPGAYRVMTTTIQGLRTPIGRWWLKSVTVRGRELLDAPLEARESADDAVVTFSDRASEVSGTVARPSAGDVPEGYVVVFSTEPRAWFTHSRRVGGIRPDDEGRYSIRNLPPGEYYIAATDDVTNMEWFDRKFLEQLAARARRVTVGPEKTTVDLTWLK
jgi:protocatechuate 3,4-dioxygenase beta subunit